jgi:hypothetical protein
MSVVAMAMSQTEVSQCSRVVGMMAAGPKKVCMTVMMSMNVPMVVMVKVVVETVSDCVMANVVDEVVDGEHQRAKRHQPDKAHKND